MSGFPLTIVDDFYDDPDLVRHYALSLPYDHKKGYNGDGLWPGQRTECLSMINRSIYNNFLRKILSIYYNFYDESINWSAYVGFQKIKNYSDCPNSPKNRGWIHCDYSLISGVVYLNPNPSKNSGTSIYKLKNPTSGILDEEKLNKMLFRKEKGDLYKGLDVDEDQYKKSIEEVNGQFYETVKVENIYNRLFLFNGKDFHGVPSLYSEDEEERLTQVFFIHGINFDNPQKSGSQLPISRMRLGVR